MISKIRRAIRLLIRFFSLYRDEFRQFRKATREVFRQIIRNLIDYIVLKNDCLQIKKKMCLVRSYSEWKECASLLDHLEGCEKWKYRDESKNYDFRRIKQRRQMMKQLRKSDKVKTLAHYLR